MEQQLNDACSAAIKLPPLDYCASESRTARLSEDQRTEVISRGQEVVSRVQVENLKRVSILIDEVFTDPQKTYYIVIDGLDANWVDERLKYKLVMSLIDTAREFIGRRHAKVIVAIRRDLIERVFRKTRDSGFQEEKYSSSYLRLTWSKKFILEVLDTRVRQLVRRRYTKQEVGYRELLPSHYRGRQIGDVIFSLADRPRDVIALFNACIHAGVDRPVLSEQEFTKAVGEYSRGRVNALADEWYADFPRLPKWMAILSGRQASFKLETVHNKEIEELCLKMATESGPPGCGRTERACAVSEGKITPEEFRDQLFFDLYRVGVVGLKTATDMSMSWVDDLGQAVSREQVVASTSVSVAPKYAVALGVDVR